MKHPLAMVAALYLAGVLLGEFLPLPWHWLSACALALAAASFLWSAARNPLLGLLFVFTGWTNLATRTAVLSPVDLRTLVGTNVEYLTLRGTLCETPAQRIYEHPNRESWRTLARLEVAALQRGAEWQAASGRVA